MAGHRLPNLMAIRHLNGYVYCTTEPSEIQGYIGWREVDVFSPLTKIAVETSNIHRSHVNLRFCCNNRYWARHDTMTDGEWLGATSKKPNEDETHRSCTLFKQIVQEDDSFHLIHVQSGKYVVVAPNRSEYLYLGDQPTSAYWRFVDLDALVMLSKHVTFKGNNGKYLEADSSDFSIPIIHPTSFGNLKFSSDDGNAEATAYEITMNPHGYLLIKSKHTGRYWRANHEKVMADNDAGRDDATTLFWPVKLNDKTIALRTSAAHFCHRDSGDALSASSPTITREARLQLEELVSERKISEVVYHLDQVRIYDETPVVPGEGSDTNRSPENATLFIDVSYENSRSYSFKRSIDVIPSVRTHFEADIYHCVDGNIEFLSHLSAWRHWNVRTQESLQVNATYDADDVPPGRTVNVKYMAREGNYDIPFSYTQHDVLSGDGSTVTTNHDDGLFTGVNYYDFHFQQVEQVEP